MTSRLALLLLAASAAACGGYDTVEREVTVNFRAAVGPLPFACGQTYAGLGTTSTAFTPTDLRLYVHDLVLVGPDGSEAPLVLAADGVWQRDGVALLDFEDGTGACATAGTAATRTTVTGSTTQGAVSGIRFKVGVPAALNHLNAATAAAPLDKVALFWSWTSGYKHARIDGQTTGLPAGHNFHLGSTSCTPVNAADPSLGATCATANRPTIALTGFDPARNAVVLDLKALFAGSNMDVNSGGPAGCMSGTTDADCAPIFAALGLPFGGAAAGAQSAFRVQ